MAVAAPHGGTDEAHPDEDCRRTDPVIVDGVVVDGPETASPTRCPTPSAPFDPVLVERARREYAACGRRATILGPSISSDPAWNILLDLFLTEAAGRRLSVTGVCHGARSSMTTGGRYLLLLQVSGLVDRVPDAIDRRRTYVRLSDIGRATVADLLED